MGLNLKHIQPEHQTVSLEVAKAMQAAVGKESDARVSMANKQGLQTMRTGGRADLDLIEVV